MDDEFLDPNDYYADQDENRASDFGINGGASQENLHRSVGWLAAFLLLSAIVWMYSYPNWFSSSNSGATADPVGPIIVASKRPRSNIVSNKLEEITGLSMPVGEAFDWATDEKTAANRSRVNELKRQLDDISSLANKNTDGLVSLRATIAGLLTSNEGKRIAAQGSGVDEFIGLQKKASELSASLPASDNFVADVTALLNRISNAGDTNYSPADLLFSQALTYQKQQSEKADEIKRYVDATERLIRVTGHLTPGQSLAAAIEKVNEDDARKLSEAMARVRKDSLNERVTKLSNAEKARIDAETKLKAAEINAKTDAFAAKKNEAIERAARLKLEREFAAAEPEIRLYLAYLMVDGRSYRGDSDGLGPVSYKAVVESGATKAGRRGTILMSRLVGSNGHGQNGNNDRAIHSNTLILTDFMYTQPQYGASIQFAEKAKALFCKFGLLMKEKGMLAD